MNFCDSKVFGAQKTYNNAYTPYPQKYPKRFFITFNIANKFPSDLVSSYSSERFISTSNRDGPYGVQKCNKIVQFHVIFTCLHFLLDV